MKKCIESNGIKIESNLLFDITQKLCHRVGDVPFLEVAEELRLQVIDTLVLLMKKHRDAVTPEIAETILHMLVKALADLFPSVKRSSAELSIMVVSAFPSIVQKSFKGMLKVLQANASHQHSKTRLVTLQAVGCCLNCLQQDDYEAVFKDSVLNLFSRLVSDRTTGVKIELANTCKNILAHRLSAYRQHHRPLSNIDFELVSILLLLRGDEQEEVANAADTLLKEAVLNWHKDMLRSPTGLAPNEDVNTTIEDGEWEMINAAKEQETAVDSEGNSKKFTNNTTVLEFLVANFAEVSTIVLAGVDGWTTDSKFSFLRGLNQLLFYTEGEFSRHLPRIFISLGAHIRDEEVNVRVAAEQCCTRIGSLSKSQDILEILLPKVAGDVAGGDTATQRTSAIRMLTHALEGFSQFAERQLVLQSLAFAAASRDVHDIDESDDTQAQAPSAMEMDETSNGDEAARMEDLITSITATLSSNSLYEFRDAPVREAALLLVRAILDNFPEECKACNVMRRNLAVCLVCLCSRCPNEHDIVPDIASKELSRLAAYHFPTIAIDLADNADALVNQFLSAHYQFIFNSIVLTKGASIRDAFSTSAGDWKGFSPAWESASPSKAAFEVLIRKCPTASWAHQEVVLSVFLNQVQPPTPLTPDSAEANAQNYAAVRGENFIPSSVAELVDVRMSLLALLEGFIRAGSADWENGRYISEGGELILRDIILPNLVWRVGRVEATVRKVALAACYGMLKAGSIRHEVLFKVAGELVPRICSNLDDQESTPRQISALCLTTLFVRLKGAFGDQALREMYPKLIARLDDSSDAVRLSICGTLSAFLQCSPIKAHYKGTMIDYILDQLFIHLDDTDVSIQNAVLQVIVTASEIEKELVLKKAENNRLSHRATTMCDKVVAEVQGFEILED